MAATLSYYSGQGQSQESFHRSVAMGLALVLAIVISPLYHVKQRKSDIHHHETWWWWWGWWNSGFLLPLLLAGLIIAIRVASSSSSSLRRGAVAQAPIFPSSDSSFVLRFGSSSWGLAAVLVLLLLVLSWQDSVQGFLRK